MPKTPQAEIIAVGSELLSSSRHETNSLFVTGALESLGIAVVRKMVVGDSREQIAQALSAGLEASDILVFTGGLGPTSDDLTREAVAEALSRQLQLNDGVLRRLEKIYQRIGREMTENNLRQAMVPMGAKVLTNPKGTAPGLFLRQAERLIFLLPGPPRELQPMVREKVLPLIRQYKEVTPRPHRQLRVASLAESAVDHEVRPLYESYRDIRATILSSPGVIDLLLSWTGEPLADLANQQLDSLVSDIHRQLGVAVFTDRPEGLEAVTGELLQKKGLNLATAESCTGGLVGKLLTDVSGSSSYYLGGVVSYSNRLKESLLEVKRDALEKFGAVSEPVARQMAAGVCRLTGADLGLSVTGIAGPGGGSREKPVGLICFGLCLGGVTESREILLPGDRDVIRLRSARFAIDWVRRRVLQG